MGADQALGSPFALNELWTRPERGSADALLMPGRQLSRLGGRLASSTASATRVSDGGALRV